MGVKLMREIMNAGGPYEYAWMYFLAFQICVTQIFTNIMIAIIVHQYSFTARTSDSKRRAQDRILSVSQATVITHEWSLLDPLRTGFIRWDKIDTLLRNLPRPMGWRRSDSKVKKLRMLRRMELRMTEDGQVHFLDAYVSIALYMWRVSKKSHPIESVDLKLVRGKLALELAQRFPSMSQVDESCGLVANFWALTLLQGKYKARIFKGAMKKAMETGDFTHLKALIKAQEKSALGGGAAAAGGAKG